VAMRVMAYSFTLVTDQYPPFSLAREITNRDDQMPEHSLGRHRYATIAVV